MLERLSLAALVGTCGLAAGEDRIPVLLLTGENNHNWRYTSRMFEDTLEATGRFEVDVRDDAAAALEDWEGLTGYRVVVLDYNGPRWGEAAEANFVKAVTENALGVVVIHAANNAFPGWAPYERMVGLLWRQGTGHGRFHEFDVVWTDEDHPIAGMGALVAHPDELYHELKNPQGASFEVIAEARSSTESGGTGKDEPMAIVREFGEGRVFHTPLGHVWTNVEETKASISDPQFKVLLARGTEWAATGSCTIESAEDVREHNVLTSEERDAGWALLFDGETLTGMRGFRQEGFPSSGWRIEEGTLATEGGGPDVITTSTYEDFEFSCEWKVSPGGNSGIIYLVTEDHPGRRASSRRAEPEDSGRDAVRDDRVRARRGAPGGGVEPGGGAEAGGEHRALAERVQGRGVRDRVGRVRRAGGGEQVQPVAELRIEPGGARGAAGAWGGGVVPEHQGAEGGVGARTGWCVSGGVCLADARGADQRVDVG